MFTIKHRSTDALYCERKRLMYDVDAVERGECLMTPDAYEKTLHRLAVVDREIEHRERENARLRDE